MHKVMSRREALIAASVVPISLVAADAIGAQPPTPTPAPTAPPTAPSPADAAWKESFPTTEGAMAREIVGASHNRKERVAELLKISPRLANAAHDWGFGDWETPLGAASHVGNRAIALMLIEHGARTDVFALAMLGRLEAVKAAVAADPKIVQVRGPHGLTLMHHARAGGDEAKSVAEFLSTLPEHDPKYANLPLSEADRAAVVGEYRFGGGSGEVFRIYFDERAKTLRHQRGDRSPNNLFHVGSRVFHPAGAPEVRLTFSAESPAASVAITTPAPLVVAVRVG